MSRGIGDATGGRHRSPPPHHLHGETSHRPVVPNSHADDTAVSSLAALVEPKPKARCPFKFDSEPFRQGSYIRLIKILPDLLDDRLSLEIRTFDLDEGPVFNALSYAWGDSTKTHTARVSTGAGCGDLLIIANLDSALRGVQPYCQDEWLWADAICVNQEDVLERNHQVQLMARIYGTARKVTIWLGGDPDSSGAQALDLATRISNDDMFAQAMIDNLEDGRSTDRSDIYSLQSLLDRPWFLRMWTMQEVGLSKDAVVVCGSRSLPWFELHNTYEIFFRRLHQQTLDALGFDPERIIFLQKWATAWLWATSRDLSFLDCLVAAQRKECTDPRDRVFALLSHPSARNTASHELIMQPDYAADLTDVYLATCAGVIRQTNSLDILRHAQPRDLEFGEPSCPSYTPQWHTTQTIRLLPRASTLARIHPTRPSQPIATVVPLPGHRRPSLQTLGIPLGSITFISERLTKSTAHDPWRNKSLLKLLTKTMASASIAFPPRARYPVEAFFRVLCGGKTHDVVPYLKMLCSKKKTIGFGYRKPDSRVMALFENVDAGRDAVLSDELIPSVGEVCEGRRVFLTNHGQIGIAAEGVGIGDQVWALGEEQGSWFVLRRKKKAIVGNEGRVLWELKGECYVEEFRDHKGEEERGREWREVYLV